MRTYYRGELCYFWDADGDTKIKGTFSGRLPSTGLYMCSRGIPWLKCISVKEAKGIKFKDDIGIKLAAFIGGLEEDVEFLKQKIDAKEHLLSMIREQISDE